MELTNLTVKKSLYGLAMLLLLGGCGTNPPEGHALNHHDSMERTLVNTQENTEFLIKMDAGSFCRAGDFWGAKLRNSNGNQNGKHALNPEFVQFLRTGEMNAESKPTPLGRFYFGVTQELRTKFNSCFKTSYARIDADDVLGYHVSTAAGEIGREIGVGYAKWPQKFFQINLDRSNSYAGKFDNLLKETNTHAVAMLELFEELLTTGSPADRHAFQNGFICGYRESMIRTLGEMAKEMPVVSQKHVASTEDLSKTVICPNAPITGYELSYTRTNNFMTRDLEGQFYANHATEASDTDKLAFRIFSAEEIYLRNYRRALHFIGLKVGKAMFHGLKERNDGLEYLRNLSLAVEKNEDLQLYMAPGFMAGFEHNGEKYLNDMLSQLNLSRANPAAKPAAQKDKPAAQTDKPAASPAKISKNEAQPSAATLFKSENKPEVQQASTTSKDAAAATSGKCFVHVGSFQKEHYVQSAQNALKQSGIDNVSVKSVPANQNDRTIQLMQVRVGPFASPEMARSERPRVSKIIGSAIGDVVCDI